VSGNKRELQQLGIFRRGVEVEIGRRAVVHLEDSLDFSLFGNGDANQG
jgi:hypothetical protein